MAFAVKAGPGQACCHRDDKGGTIMIRWLQGVHADFLMLVTGMARPVPALTHRHPDHGGRSGHSRLTRRPG